MERPQNIYDDPAFFAAYAELRKSDSGLNEILEQPALWSLLPLTGLRILDLGCGFGNFARRARQAGAGFVLGIDCSQRMLAKAKELTNDRLIQYRCMSLEELEIKDETFDIAVSSLAIHYVSDYPTLLRHVAPLLKTGGRFVFSVEHPICTAIAKQQWLCDRSGKQLYWPVDEYRSEGPRSTRWFIDNVVKYHRTIETYVSGLIDAGFQLLELRERVRTIKFVVGASS